MKAVLQGDVSAFRLPDVLTFLCTTRKSGTLILTNGAAEAYLFYRDGALVYAGSNQEHFRLGSILLRKKKITREQPDLLNRVALLSVRQAKGLEFDTVIVVEPHRIVAESPRGLSDHNVAVTRTTKRLGVLHTAPLPAALDLAGATV